MKTWIGRSARILFLFALAPGPLAAAETYVEDFDDEANGPPQDWFVYWQTCEIAQGRLSIYPTGQAPFAYAGRDGEPIFFDGLKRIRFTVEYLGWPADDIGRHGGIVFCCTEPTQRYGATFRGYVVDWIDRVTGQNDHGYRIHKLMDGGTHYPLHAGSVGTDKSDPGTEWEIVIDDEGFRLIVDGEDFGHFADTELVHSGYVGFWCHTNAGQNLLFDDVEIESSGCSELLPMGTLAADPGETVGVTIRIPPSKNETADYAVTVETSNPAIAVPVGAAGDSLTVTFPAGGSLSQSFDVLCKAPGRADLCLVAPGAGCDATCVTIDGDPDDRIYEKDFTDDPDGPSEDWMVATPGGNVLSGEYELAASGAEPTAYIGIAGQPIFFHGLKRVQFRIRFGDQVDPAVGGHGGIILAARSIGATRYGSPNYVFDWLARDFTYRLYKTVDGAQVFWPTVIADAPAPYWRIEFAGTTIRAFATDEEMDFFKPVDTGAYPPVFEVNDLTHRSGYVGFWGYSNLNQQVYIDDVKIMLVPPQCPSIAPAAQLTWLDEPDPNAAPPQATITIPFGANQLADCAVTVTSSDPTVAVPAGAPGGSLVLTFRKGDPLVQDVEFQAVGAGTARFSLTVDGAQCPGAVADIEVKALTPSFCDTFDQADGAPEKWTLYAGDATVGEAGIATVEAGEMLVTRTVATQTWVWANNDDGAPARFAPVETISLNVDLFTPTPDAVGRHGGIMFCATSPTHRHAASGYEIDWIDRVDDHGYRVLRSDGGAHTLIAGPTLDLFPEPAAQWTFEIDEEAVRFFADDELVFEVFDATYRGGYVGLWTYSGGTEMRVDDVAIGMSIEECGGGGKTKFVRGSADGDANYTIGDG
ncbi:MAG: hypothetical protein JXP34_11455, partial [Planctomycetes bacterium]|nr:hypothetical protein [Planctomycetota bacterium]